MNEHIDPGADADGRPFRDAVVRTGSRALFVAFLGVGVSGFGGVLPFVRRMLVERRRWLTETEFTEVLALAQFLPGPNVVNVAIIVGRRFRGPAGAVAAAFGLMLLPVVVVLMLAALYAEFAQVAAVRGATRAVSAAASGLVLAVALKMARPLVATPWRVAVGVVVFVAIGLLRLPLLGVLAVLMPLSVGIAWRQRR
jgi:chromate transporter